MSATAAFGLPIGTLRRATLSGLAIGAVYALSPLTVWFAIAIVPLIGWGISGLDPDERRWVARLLIVAVVLRLTTVAGLCALTDHSRVPFGSFFGDEEFFIKRSLWLRSLALGRMVHGTDLQFAFEPSSASSYLYLLALVQILVGPSPYGVHLISIAFYLLGVILLYRAIRPALGRWPALLGLAVLLFLPSLFAWSVSALKDPLFMLVNAVSFVFVLRMVRASSWGRRALALAAVAALAAALESIRPGGAALSAVGIGTGLSIGFLAARPRFLLAVLVAAPLLVGAVFSRPGVQLKAYTAVQSAARQHWGSVVVSPGYAYRLLDARFYSDVNEISGLRFAETMRFLARAAVVYVTVPLPWKVQSRAALIYLPEQILWYVLAALALVGLPFAFRRDAIVTGLLLGHAAALAAAVALTDGNVGTLVRHRGLALPYLIWISAVGACELLPWFERGAPARSAAPMTRPARMRMSTT